MDKHYCGSDTFPDWVKKLLSFPLNDACRLHDRFYDSKNVSKFKADLIFLFFGLKVSVTWLTKGVLGIVLIPIYFIAVLFFGAKSWRREQ